VISRTHELFDVRAVPAARDTIDGVPLVPAHGLDRRAARQIRRRVNALTRPEQGGAGVGSELTAGYAGIAATTQQHLERRAGILRLEWVRVPRSSARTTNKQNGQGQYGCEAQTHAAMVTVGARVRPRLFHEWLATTDEWFAQTDRSFGKVHHSLLNDKQRHRAYLHHA
jgi:hypothetical protein